MDYRMLGGSGCAVSSLCLGTMTFGGETDEAGAHAQLDRFLAAGGTSATATSASSPSPRPRVMGRPRKSHGPLGKTKIFISNGPWFHRLRRQPSTSPPVTVGLPSSPVR